MSCFHPDVRHALSAEVLPQPLHVVSDVLLVFMDVASLALWTILSVRERLHLSQGLAWERPGWNHVFVEITQHSSW